MKSGTQPRLIVLAAAALAWACGAASAQTYHGSVRGQVRDQQGMISGTAITLINEETSASRTVFSNEVGEYAFAGVLPGMYTIRASLVGFKTEERKAIRIVTYSSIVHDFELQIGAISEHIAVTGDALLGERASAAVSTSLSAQQISTLPIFGRNTFYSAISTPSVIQSGDPQFVRYQDQTNASLLSLAGGPRRGNEIGRASCRERVAVTVGTAAHTRNRRLSVR